MTTTTETTTDTDVLAELTAREEKFEHALAEANAIGTELTEAQQRQAALEEELRGLYQDDPESFDHTGVPLKASSPAGKTAKQLADLGLDDVAARYQHARQIEQRADQSRSDYIRAHYAKLMEAIEPEAQAVIDKLQRSGQALHMAAQEYFGLAQRIDGWKGAASQRDHDLRQVRFVGTEYGSALLKATKQFVDEHVPSPTETR